MTTTKELRTYVQKKIAEYPELRGQIMDLFQLCLDEIDEGGSIIHEIQLCINDIEETINESLEETKRL